MKTVSEMKVLLAEKKLNESFGSVYTEDAFDAQYSRFLNVLESFEKRFDESFGEHTEICPRNLLSGSSLELCTDDVKVRVDAAHSDLVETRLLEGKPCIIIHAEGNLTVNGISVKIRK